jgi:flagellar basal-body rod modification protein FlgD
MTVTAAAGAAFNATNTAAAATSNAGSTIAQNFTAFLQLLTTQLRNQNPLEPLDTNQFTQQLVQFAQVEQQISTNSSLSTLITLQQAAQTSAAMGFLGATVRVDGNVAKLADGQATWAFNAEKPATGTFNVHGPSGEVLYTESRTITAGSQSFTWNGRDSAGNAVPDGSYTLSLIAKDASGQTVAVSTEVEGVVDGVDLSRNPPVLSIGGQNFTLDKIKQVRRPVT